MRYFLNMIKETIKIVFPSYFFVKRKDLLPLIVDGNRPFYNFLKNKWYFDEIYEFLFVKSLKKIGLYFWKKIDGLVIDRFGPDGISRVVKFLSTKATQFQSGYIYDYAFVMLLGLSILLTYLILK